MAVDMTLIMTTGSQDNLDAAKIDITRAAKSAEDVVQKCGAMTVRRTQPSATSIIY